MRIASFDVENMFERAKALNLPTWAARRPTLERHARINSLLNEPVYGPAEKTEIIALLQALGLAAYGSDREPRRQRHSPHAGGPRGARESVAHADQC